MFDSNFIHRNIFTGLTIDRGNQENITRFILGEEGAQIATTISNLNIEFRKINRDIQELGKTAFQEIANIESFVGMKVSETMEDIENRLQDLRTRKSEFETTIENLENIVRRDVPAPLNPSLDFAGFVEKVNKYLGSSFQQVHDSTLERIGEHIKNYTKSPITTETWISQGIELLVENTCPFCGQELDDRAKELIGMYQQYFDDSFKRFVSETSKALDGFESKVNGYQLSGVLHITQQNMIILKQYPELSSGDGEVAQHIRALEDKSREIKIKLEKWLQEYSEIKTTLLTKTREKRNAIYAGVTPWECARSIAIFDDITALHTEYDELLNNIARVINAFKGSLDQQTMAKKILELEKEISSLNEKAKRLNLNTACTKYADLVNRRKVLKTQLGRQRVLLEHNQIRYIGNYFDQINALFSILGSRNFNLSHRLNRRGHMPTLELVASYSGVEITQDKLYAFFSESDKRALALSIFLAKVDSLNDQHKKQTIIVLDDPVTSFDDGRIDRLLRLMDRIESEVRQVIVLLHYPTYLKRYFDRVNNSMRGTKLICIRQDENGSYFDEVQASDFTETAQEIKYRHITGYIDRRHRDDICNDLRIFLENEVRSRFYMQIIKKRLTGLTFGELISKLYSLGTINEETCRQLNEFRLSLNPDHHIWTTRQHEDKISLATDVISFIYYIL